MAATRKTATAKRAPARRRLSVVRRVEEVRRTVAAWRARGLRVAFVPTMGALHEGHLSLMQRAQAGADRVVVSIFVNPLQFGPGEDYRRYPRPLAKDRALLASIGIDLLWTPDVKDLYAADDRTRVRVLGLGEVLEGASRPGHFDGVATVVLKLLHAVAPDDLWLGQKDAQQVRVIEQLCRDLLVPVQVRRGATVRERDGLAYSSRNGYLDGDHRAQAVALVRGLRAAEKALRDGERSAARLKAAIRGVWRAYPLVREDYVAVVDPDTMRPLRTLERRALIAVAARVGPARLIDNLEWESR